MDIAIINDQHWGSRNDNQTILSYMEGFYCDEFFPEIDKRNIKHLIILGDLFDRRKYVNYLTLQRMKVLFFDELQSRNIAVYIIPGNHDVVYKNTNKLNSLDLVLESYSNIKIFHEPDIIEFENKRIGLVPWINQENYDQCIEFINNNSQNVDILGGHFDIKGVEMIKGIKSDVGFSQSMFTDYKQVVSGHYHTPSINNNIMYPGSPYEFTWADYGQEKGYLIYNTDKDQLDKIITNTKLFHKLYYDDTKEFEMKKLISSFSSYKDKFIKVIIREKHNKIKFDHFITELYNHNPFDVKIIESEMELGLSQDEMNIETKSTLEIIDSTIDNMTLDVPIVDLKKLFHELYIEALNIEV